MKIALIQQSAGPDIQANLEKGILNAQKAIADGARIISFAELAFTPFYPQSRPKRSLLKLAETIPGPTTDSFTKLAKEYGVVFVLNLFERDGNNTFDSSPVIDADGHLKGITRMVHITDYDYFFEQDYYQPGDSGAPVYETRYGRIGVAICYDRHYPEYMRALALNGAEIVFIPQAGAVGEWPDGLYEAEMQVAAFQNGYFTALCNRVGKEKYLTFCGESFICDPFGKIIAQAGEGKDAILIADLDLKQVNASHARRLFFRDRRPELYPHWFKP